MSGPVFERRFVTTRRRYVDGERVQEVFVDADDWIAPERSAGAG